MAWRAADVPAVLRAFASAAAAVPSIGIWAVHDHDGSELRPGELPGVPTVDGGDFRRQPGEAWSAYVARSGSAARERLEGFLARTASVLPPSVATYAGFRGVAEGELTLFDIPTPVRTEIREQREQWRGPWEPIYRSWRNDGSYVRRAGPVAAGSFYHHYAQSLTHVPRGARFLSLDGGAADVSALDQFSALEMLEVSSVSASQLPTFGRLDSLQSLKLSGRGEVDLAPLARMPHLENLIVGDFGQITGLETLAALPQLRTLELSINPGQRQRTALDLREVGSLLQLRGLRIHSSIFRSLRVATLAPLATLTRLRHLGMIDVRAVDESLAPLAHLTELRDVGIPNYYSVEEFAWLAAALPHARGKALTPIFSGDVANPERSIISRCKKCGSDRDYVLTTGKPSRRLCPICERSKIDKHIARWDGLVAEAQAQLADARSAT